MNVIHAYMTAHAFGDYSRATAATREERHAAALEYAAHEQTRPSFWASLGMQQACERYESGTATARDLMTLQAAKAITPDQAEDYRSARGWTPRKFGGA